MVVYNLYVIEMVVVVVVVTEWKILEFVRGYLCIFSCKCPCGNRGAGCSGNDDGVWVVLVVVDDYR